MTDRDPAADARTIAARHISELSWFHAEEIAEVLGDVPPDVLQAIRAELAEIAQRLTLALHPDAHVKWSYATPSGHVDWAPGTAGYNTRAVAERIARDAAVDGAQIACRLVTPWQPAPTTGED